MWRHMEKLPKRPAIIDSLQWCTYLAHLQTRDIPLISATQTEPQIAGEGVKGCWREGGKKIKRGNQVP